VSRDDHRIDMEEVARLAREHRPKVIIGAARPIRASSTSLPSAQLTDEVGAYLMVDMAHFAGLVAGGAHSQPIPSCPCRHLDHAQDAARPARGFHPD